MTAKPSALQVALVGGPMYDGLYRALGLFDDPSIEVIIHADHPTLNRVVAAHLSAGRRIDVLSTHSKYAPSQAAGLRRLDDLMVGPLDEGAFAGRAVGLCRFGGELLALPRNIDVRTLWADVDRVPAVPTSWLELDDAEVAFGFTGRDSGLFGTFFEMVVAAGGALFDPDGGPTMTSSHSADALARLARLARRLPPGADQWHYDDVDAALGDGTVALAAAWPGATAMLRASAAGPRLRPHRYLDGISYSGCHAWAIPTTCGDLDGAVALLGRLCNPAAHAADAAAGTVPARLDALAAVEPADDIDASRWAVLRATIEGGMITYPPLARFPEIEDACWSAIQSVLAGRVAVEPALAAMQGAAEAALA